MMNNKLLSIIVPIYNSENYIDECIKSLISQDYENIEIILINDGSNDNTLKKIKYWIKKDNRIVLINKKNSGVSDTRNIGLRNAKGEYIAFIDSDDNVSKKSYSLMISALEKVNADMCFASYTIKKDDKAVNITFPWEDGKIFENKQIKNIFIPKIVGKIKPEKKTIFGSVWRVVFKKNIIYKLNFDTEVKVAEDVLFLIDSLSIAKKIITLNECVYNYIQHSDSTLKKYKKDYYEMSEIYHCKLINRLNNINYFDSSENFKRYSLNRFYRYMYTLTNLPRNENKNTKNTLKQIKYLSNEIRSDKYINKEIITELDFMKKIIYFLLKNKLTIFIYIIIETNHFIRW